LKVGQYFYSFLCESIQTDLSRNCRAAIYTDSCDGSIIQYYAETNCTTLIHEAPVQLGDQAGCNEYTGDRDIAVDDDITLTVPAYFYKVYCTAQPSAPISVQSATLEYVLYARHLQRSAVLTYCFCPVLLCSVPVL